MLQAQEHAPHVDRHDSAKRICAVLMYWCSVSFYACIVEAAVEPTKPAAAAAATVNVLATAAIG